MKEFAAELELQTYDSMSVETFNNRYNFFHAGDLFRTKGIIQRKKNNFELSEKYLMMSLEINSSKSFEYALTCSELSILYQAVGKSMEAELYSDLSNKILEILGSHVRLPASDSHINYT
jgi:hypothetical protein